MERKRIIKDGQIVVKNPLYQELPKREVVIKSGKTLYRFTGSYDGKRIIAEQSFTPYGTGKGYRKKLIKRTGADIMSPSNPVWQTARRRKERNYVKAV